MYDYYFRNSYLQHAERWQTYFEPLIAFKSMQQQNVSCLYPMYCIFFSFWEY